MTTARASVDEQGRRSTHTTQRTTGREERLLIESSHVRNRTSTTPPTAPQWACRRARRGSGRLDGCVLVRVHVQSIARSACALVGVLEVVEWPDWAGHPGNFRLRFLALALSHWLSPLRPLARASCGSPAGRGGGGRLDGRRRWRGHDRQERSSICQEICMGTKRNPSFSWHCDLLDYAYVHSLLLSGTLLQPLCSLSSHFSHSPTHFHSQLEFPIKTKSLHIFRAGARPLCKSGPLIAPPTTLMVWAGSPP